ncbi:MAG: hypothetical protein DCC49_06185 [Acidobacteria bacterium]|nr:MAG: hypothetical protein DCC49_06185 [Acidobacteriota bacterium]
MDESNEPSSEELPDEPAADEESSEDPEGSSELPPVSWGAGERAPRRFRALRCAGVVAAVTAVMLVAGSVSAFAYDQSRDQRIVPDVRVDGVLVGGLTRDEAAAELRRNLDSVRSRKLTIKAYDKAYTVSLAQLDVEADIEGAVDEAFAVGHDLGIGGRLKRWIGGGGDAIDIPMEIRPNGEAVDKKVIASIAGQVNREATEAAIDESSDDLVFRPAEPGVELEAEAASEILMRAAVSAINGETITEVVLPAKELRPEGNDIGAAILVRVSEQKLYYYENAALVGTYKVSTGTSGYPTPLGRFRIVEKIMNPSWVNPAPTGWGKDMPARIGPGPGNPLGTRALALNSPGILIHGTTKVNLLGSPASHGCVRMAGSDIEGLFPKVPVNTPVFIRK